MEPSKLNILLQNGCQSSNIERLEAELMRERSRAGAWERYAQDTLLGSQNAIAQRDMQLHLTYAELNAVAETLRRADEEHYETRIELREARSQLSSARHGLDDMRTEIVDTRGHLSDTRQKLHMASAELTATQSALDRSQAKLGEAEGTISKMVVDITKTNDEVKMLTKKTHQLSRTADKYRHRAERAKESKERAVRTAIENERSKRTIHHVKHNGTITSQTRQMILDLIESGVPQGHVWDVFYRTAHGLGINVQGSFSTRSVGHIINEGGVVASLISKTVIS
ncbi:hypothetical protein K474DRAFT_1711010 [Panus rudis PR-1116 ss-1]|nr:hypothetical protein K474DRAFT_1711010 [Panus rudis PR-1116 ss-1]